MIWRLATLAAALACGGCASIPASQPQAIKFDIAEPVSARDTGHPWIYETPETIEGTDMSGILAQHSSMLGREDLSAATGDKEYEPSACQPMAGSPIGTDAVIARIVDEARKHRVVIINESHVVTSHRDFSRKLIAALRPEGFAVLAAETFGNNAADPDPVETYDDLPYIDRRIGYYSMEPVFGAMLREAKALGYRFVAYEQVRDPNRERPDDWRISIRNREIEQASNLAGVIESLRPDEKLIVHVGYSHAREAVVIGDDGWEHAWMAARLKRITGIDPLTIDQTYCRGSSDSVQLAMESGDKQGWFDIYIDHPLPAFIYGKPAWRLDGVETVPIPEQLRPVDGPLVIEAFAEGEPFDAVPYDRIWAEPGEDIKLALPPGRYTLRAVRPNPEHE